MRLLTEKEKEAIIKLNDPLYTADFVEEWINRSDNIVMNPAAALKAISAKGYHQAVRNMIKAGLV